MLDKQLTHESNLFSYLEHGDVVLADRGFTILEDLAVHGAVRNTCFYTWQKPTFATGG